MTPMVFILVLIGVCYVSELLMRFIVWLDGADECEEDGITVGGYYCDDGWSGTNFERPDFKRMLDDIEAGKGAKYTKPRRPVELAYYETFATKQEAMRREAEIKRLTRQEKLALIEARKG